MTLFSQQGFKATSVAQIEAAAGLAPGSGALYHHFKSKKSLLEAGIDRQLDRRIAMRDIRELFAGLNDRETELTLLGRYLLSVLDDESQLLQVCARTPASQSTRLRDAYTALVDGLYAELSDWVCSWAPGLDDGTARTISVVAVDALIGHRITHLLFHATETQTSDNQYLTEWTALLAARMHDATA
jgi:AcrR family transcriptional regulator